MKLTGASRIAGEKEESGGAEFYAVNPANGAPLEPRFFFSTIEDVDHAAQFATGNTVVSIDISRMEVLKCLTRLT